MYSYKSLSMKLTQIQSKKKKKNIRTVLSGINECIGNRKSVNDWQYILNKNLK